MPNRAYLICSNSNAIHPDIGSPENHFLAEAAYGVPLLWMALFRPNDIKQREVMVKDRPLSLEAPTTTRMNAISQLADAVPYLNHLFRSEGPIDEHASIFGKFLQAVELDYLTIDFDEVASMGERTDFYKDFRNALGAIEAKNLSQPKSGLLDRLLNKHKTFVGQELLAGFATLSLGRKFPTPNQVLGNHEMAEEDLRNYDYLFGAQCFRKVPWHRL